KTDVSLTWARAAGDAEVVRHLRGLWQRGPVREGPPRRGPAGQRPEREQEQRVRRHAVAAGLDLQAAGWPLAQAADFFHLAPRTWRSWRHDGACACPLALPLGRPVRAA